MTFCIALFFSLVYLQDLPSSWHTKKLLLINLKTLQKQGKVLLCFLRFDLSIFCHTIFHPLYKVLSFQLFWKIEMLTWHHRLLVQFSCNFLGHFFRLNWQFSFAVSINPEMRIFDRSWVPFLRHFEQFFNHFLSIFLYFVHFWSLFNVICCKILEFGVILVLREIRFLRSSHCVMEFLVKRANLWRCKNPPTTFRILLKCSNPLTCDWNQEYLYSIFLWDGRRTWQFNFEIWITIFLGKAREKRRETVLSSGTWKTPNWKGEETKAFCGLKIRSDICNSIPRRFSDKMQKLEQFSNQKTLQF